MTVEEVAGYLKLSPMMVYKLAQMGRIPSRKIGRVWRFPKDAIDEWMRVPAVKVTASKVRSNDITAILHDFVDVLRNEYGPRLCRVILFGSHARGEASERSDIDTLVVLDRVDRADRRKVSETAYAVTFGRGRARHLASIVMAEERYLTDVTPLLINIRREGREAA